VKNKDGAKWILVIPDSERADLKAIAAKLNSPRFSFCTPKEMMEDIGVKPGSVTPLAIANNDRHNVALVMDKKIVDNGVVNCHPMTNTATISIAYADLKKFAMHAGHEITVMELT
jgi:Ala-tRNA(Pro) deacylase